MREWQLRQLEQVLETWATSRPLRNQPCLTPSSTEPTILMTQLPSQFLPLLPQLTHTVPVSTAFSEDPNDKKKEI